MSLTRLISSKAVTSCIHQAAIRPFSVSVMKLDQVTHTGQQFAEGDQRNARFGVTGLEKQVNTQWAIDLIAAVPPTLVTKRVVSVPYVSKGLLVFCHISVPKHTMFKILVTTLIIMGVDKRHKKEKCPPTPISCSLSSYVPGFL